MCHSRPSGHEACSSHPGQPSRYPEVRGKVVRIDEHRVVYVVEPTAISKQ